MKKKPAKKRVSKLSKPVLTSPWKLGMLVSLLLILVGAGVGGYLVSLYGIRFSWIAVGPTGLSFDSFGFFREMYPLVAVVTVVSLIAYFLVASSIRRYRFYLDSGQDYRKMISLAESIDDLTNPAQIGRLSAFPELQRVLRSYGDQIRDIARDIGQEQDPLNVNEFEGDVETLLGEGSVPASAFGSKPYSKGLQRIVRRLAEDRAKLEEMSKQEETGRQLIGRAALTCGRIVEAASGAGEELVEMVKTINDLDRAAQELAAERPQASLGETVGQDAWKAAAADVAGAARALENGKSLLQELSEENNGVAIGLALAAARDTSGGRELAALADRIRITAERFNSLSETVETLAKKLLSACYALKEVAPPSAAEASPAGSDERIRRAIVDIADAIGQRSATLQSRLCSLGNELSDMRELFPTNFAGEFSRAGDSFADSSEPAPVSEDDEASMSAGVTGTFVIDHGSMWAGMPESAANETAAAEEQEPDAPEASAAEESCEQAHVAPEASEVGDFSDMSSLRDLNGAAKKREAAVEEPKDEVEARGDAAGESESAGEERGETAEEGDGAPESPPASDGAWMEMPGHRWRKIDIGKAETDEARPVDVTVESPVLEAAAEDAAPPESERDDGEDRIYDLSELGAIEYVEEIHARS